MDNYFIYISEVLAQVYRKRPEMLKSEEKVTFEFILEHDTMDDLIGELVEIKINKMSSALHELREFVLKNLKIDLFCDDDTFYQAHVYNELRNLIVHKRGIVDRRFARKIPHYEVAIGDLIETDFHNNDALAALPFLLEAVNGFDAKIISKYGPFQPQED